jgi:hypothetical protein
MGEHEMRLRVFRFLKARMRNMIMPATVGIGLAVGGCTDSWGGSLYMGPLPRDAGLDADTAGMVPLYMVSMPKDAGPDATLIGQDAPAARDGAGAEMDKPSDAAVALDSASAIDALVSEAGSRDVMPDLGGMKYIAPFFDAAADAIHDAATDAMDTPIAKYIAPMPDAAISDTPAMRYMAQIPDADRAAPLYMAPPPVES